MIQKGQAYSFVGKVTSVASGISIWVLRDMPVVSPGLKEQLGPSAGEFLVASGSRRRESWMTDMSCDLCRSRSFVLVTANKVL